MELPLEIRALAQVREDKSAVAQRRHEHMQRPDDLQEGKVDASVALACFAVAAAIGLVAAFVGIGARSLWYDELYTAWVVQPGAGWAEMVSRTSRDISPPLYYFLLWPSVQLLGDGEVGLRLFSGLCAVAAILVLIIAGGPLFSLRGRLFAAAIATGSGYWFAQAQNARYYSLALLISTGILLLSLRAMARYRQDGRQIQGTVACLLALMLVGSFVHFYLLYESLAVLTVLGLYNPRQRVLFISFAGALLFAAILYLKLVIVPFSHFSMEQNWIPGHPRWYAIQLASALQQSLTHKAMLALTFCALAGLPAVARALRKPSGRSLHVWLADHADLVLFISVPLITLAAGVTSSIVMTPNFTARNLLVCSPFLWALTAAWYDRSIEPSAPSLRRTANVGLSVIVVWMATTMAAGRSERSSEPFRESAADVVATDACRGETIPIVVTERKNWFRSTRAEIFLQAIYAKYLNGFATPRPIYYEDIIGGTIPDHWKEILRPRIDGRGCPILAWAAHSISRDEAMEIGRKILAAADRPENVSQLRMVIAKAGGEAYVLYMARAALAH